MDIEPIHYILLAGIGVIAGYINVLAGGGSLLTLPFMIFMGIPGPLANGTNRIAIFLQNFSSVMAFKQKGFSDLKLSLSLGLAALPGAVVGALMGTRLDGVMFARILAGVMIMVLILMSKKKAKKIQPETDSQPLSRQALINGHLCMIGVGVYIGFIQAGVGFILMAVLHRVMGINLVRVNMHKVFIVGFATLPTLLIYALHGSVLWSVGLCLATGQATGAWLGTHAAVTFGDLWIRRVLRIAIVIMAIRLLWISFG